jgi:hypothetical protein
MRCVLSPPYIGYMARFWDSLFRLICIVGVAVGVFALLMLGFRFSTLGLPPKGITPEDIQQMTVTEKRVLGRCQLQKLWRYRPNAEKAFLEWEKRAQQSGHPFEYILYQNGYWCDKQERHDFWSRPQYD